MDIRTFAKLAVDKFDGTLEENLERFIQADRHLSDLYVKNKNRYSRRVVNNILNDFLVKSLREHRPFFFSNDSEYAMVEDFLEQTANRFIESLPDLVFINIENDSELMSFFYLHPDFLKSAQNAVDEELTSRYYLIPSGIEEDKPISNLLNRYRRLMLKSDEEC